MKWLYNFKKFFIDKKNLNLLSIKYQNKFNDTKYINAYFLKETVISNEMYNNFSNDFSYPNFSNLKTYSLINNHIYDSTLFILKKFDSQLQMLCIEKRKSNSFAYLFKLDLKNYSKGYISFNFFPNIYLNDTQLKQFNDAFLRDFFLISQLLFTSNKFIAESEKYVNKYSNLNIHEAVECVYNNLSNLLDKFFLENKKQLQHEKNRILRSKHSYY